VRTGDVDRVRAACAAYRRQVEAERRVHDLGLRSSRELIALIKEAERELHRIRGG